MYQQMVIPIDHGNQQIKTEHFTYTSGLEEADNRPSFGSWIFYNQKYYTLTEKRIPYLRDKTQDERFFILSLFGIAKEIEAAGEFKSDSVIRVEMPIGLPPKHYGSLYDRYEKYFKKDEVLTFLYHGKKFDIYIDKTVAYPQDYAAAMTIHEEIEQLNKSIVIDIGGFTLDYLTLHYGEADLGGCDSLENGIIKLYNQIISRVNSEYNILLDSKDIDEIISGLASTLDNRIVQIVDYTAHMFVEDLFSSLRERGIDLKTCCAVFTGGGSLLLRKYIEGSEKINDFLFIDDINANAKGFKILFELDA